MIASTLTGTVALVSACSALKAVVWMRSSITAVTLSITGKIMKRPGPLTPWSLPARKTTNFCQALAILSESPMMTAATRKGGAKKMSTVLPRARPTRAQAITRKRVIGFIVPPRAWSSRASWRASLPLDAAPSVQPNRESLALPPLRLEQDPPLLPIAWETIHTVWYSYLKGLRPQGAFGVYDMVREDMFWLDKA